jgi:4-amino-4-deoxy-L-arabinose transferase-like glycosyltransferase
VTQSATPTPRLAEPAAERRRPVPIARTLPGGLSARAYGVGVALCTAAVAAFVLVQLHAWPPHEDETLALFVGRHSFGDLLETVLGRRGGAPLHFLFAFVVAHLGGGVTALRLVSALFAVGSVPVVAALGVRLGGRPVGLGAAVLASGSWVLLFHGVYGRMYSLFLFTSALSYLALERALEGGGRRWTGWALAVLATIATHPYGALVLASQGLYVVLRRVRLREAVLAFGAVLVAGIPFWRTDLVLAGRFDIGVGGGGEKLGGPLAVLRYLRTVAGDLSVGWLPVLVLVLGLVAFGLVTLARERRDGALLVAAVFGTPTFAFLVARLGSQTSPESRHLIFALPFFSALLAIPLARLATRVPVAAAVALLALVGAEVAWADHKTPALFDGEPHARVEARGEASAWLARTARRDDILFGYDPLYLGAWERNHAFTQTVVPRADPKLALSVLRATRKPLGRGIWVFDASDTNNFSPKLTIKLRMPRPASAFEARAYGPFLVVRTLAPTRTVRRYLEEALAVQAVGRSLAIGDADINYDTVERALERARSSSSTSSR